MGVWSTLYGNVRTVNKLPLIPGGAHFVGDTLNVIRAHPLVGEYEHKAG